MDGYCVPANVDVHIFCGDIFENIISGRYELRHLYGVFGEDDGVS
jgi:hypothetical protein